MTPETPIEPPNDTKSSAAPVPATAAAPASKPAAKRKPAAKPKPVAQTKPRAKAAKRAPQATPAPRRGRSVKPRVAGGRRASAERRPSPSLAPSHLRLVGAADRRSPLTAPLSDLRAVNRYQAAVTKAQVEFALDLCRIQVTLVGDVTRAATRGAGR